MSTKTDLGIMCETKEKKWGYRITNAVTRDRVSVGPFIDRESAEAKMKEANGLYKKLCISTEFTFTPAWSNPKWEPLQYKGEDIAFCRAMPE